MKIYTDANPKELSYVVGQNLKSCIVRLNSTLTNNEAEYQAVLYALLNNDWRSQSLNLLSDSQLIVNQLNRKYKIKEPRLRELAENIWALVKDRDVIFTWIPREENLAGKLLK